MNTSFYKSQSNIVEQILLIH